MFNLRNTFRMTAIAGVLSLPAFVCAQTGTTAPDNTKQNKSQTVTADKQHTGAADREMTRKIRQSIVHDKSLSTYGHNVKIVTLNGSVTLSGPVHTEDEKQKIEAAAADVAGKDKVTDNLMVKK